MMRRAVGVLGVLAGLLVLVGEAIGRVGRARVRVRVAGGPQDVWPSVFLHAMVLVALIGEGAVILLGLGLFLLAWLSL
jgi:hypothetical protein